MKISTKRILSAVLVCVICMSLISSTVMAANVTHTSAEYGGKVTVFYVNAKNTSTTKLEYIGTAGRLTRKNGGTGIGVFGYYEVLVYGKKSNGSWVQISKTNIKGKATDTLPMKGYKQYKVRVYDWKTSTIGTYKGGNYNSSAHWLYPYIPTVEFRAKSNVNSMTK